MACYVHHLPDLLPADPTREDKRAVDAAVRQVLGMTEAHCPEVWAVVKERREDPSFSRDVLAKMKETS